MTTIKEDSESITSESLKFKAETKTEITEDKTVVLGHF